MTEPPLPPLPPSGPPSGLNFSRLTEATPWPPFPAATCSTTRSTKVVMPFAPQGLRNFFWDAARGGPCCGPPLTTWSCGRVTSTRRRSHSAAAVPTGMMLTVLRPRFLPNFTAPATSANRVSSPPRPTPAPGWECVPRWRTMISPALTTWPPKRLTPRRWAFESRPLREELAPFLCAMTNLLSCSESGGPEPVGHGARAGDACDLEAGQLLAVTLALAVAGLVLVLEDVDLGTLLVPHDLRRHRHLGQRLGVGGDLLTVDEQQRRQLDGRAGLRGEAVDDDDVAHRDLLLAAASLHDRVHHVAAHLCSSNCLSSCSVETLGALPAPAHIPLPPV